MARRGSTSQFDFAQGERERNGGQRNQRQHSEGVHVGQVRRLRLHLLADPLDGLLMCLDQ